MAVGCDLLPHESYGCIADYPRELHTAAVDAINTDIEAYDRTAEILKKTATIHK